MPGHKRRCTVPRSEVAPMKPSKSPCQHERHWASSHGFSWFIRLKRAQTQAVTPQAAAPWDFLRPRSGVQWDSRKRPLVTKAIRGLTRPWRTGAWISLVRLRPRRARLRFSRRLQSIRSACRLAGAILTVWPNRPEMGIRFGSRSFEGHVTAVWSLRSTVAFLRLLLPLPAQEKGP